MTLSDTERSLQHAESFQEQLSRKLLRVSITNENIENDRKLCLS